MESVRTNYDKKDIISQRKRTKFGRFDHNEVKISIKAILSGSKKGLISMPEAGGSYFDVLL